MATRTKLTPFARLLFVLLIIVPLAYAGALYLQGKDPVAEIGATFRGEERSSTGTTDGSTYDPRAELENLKKENRHLRQRVEELEAELAAKNSGPEKWGN